jgi:hypothetical protein
VLVRREPQGPPERFRTFRRADVLELRIAVVFRSQRDVDFLLSVGGDRSGAVGGTDIRRDGIDGRHDRLGTLWCLDGETGFKVAFDFGVVDDSRHRHFAARDRNVGFVSRFDLFRFEHFIDRGHGCLFDRFFSSFQRRRRFAHWHIAFRVREYSDVLAALVAGAVFGGDFHGVFTGG